MVFQVGPTIYDGLAIVDGNFILEAARYLGYDDQAKESLAANWAWQREDGGVFAYAGDWMWKDTAIAAFSLVRQAELSQDWSNFRDMQPKLHKALQFLVELRERAGRKAARTAVTDCCHVGSRTAGWTVFAPNLPIRSGRWPG